VGGEVGELEVGRDDELVAVLVKAAPEDGEVDRDPQGLGTGG
jgi:hypothetical protein